MGYSLYDTVIVFDRIRENVPRMPRATFSQIANRSMSEVFTRSLATSFVVLMPVGALLLFGGETLKDFAFALLVGVASGAYSSIFIATPVLVEWKEREQTYMRRRRLILREHGGAVPAFATGAIGEPAPAPRVRPPPPQRPRRPPRRPRSAAASAPAAGPPRRVDAGLGQRGRRHRRRRLRRRRAGAGRAAAPPGELGPGGRAGRALRPSRAAPRRSPRSRPLPPRHAEPAAASQPADGGDGGDGAPPAGRAQSRVTSTSGPGKSKRRSRPRKKHGRR